MQPEGIFFCRLRNPDKLIYNSICSQGRLQLLPFSTSSVLKSIVVSGVVLGDDKNEEVFIGVIELSIEMVVTEFRINRQTRKD
jgi:hypothetical protein